MKSCALAVLSQLAIGKAFGQLTACDPAGWNSCGRFHGDLQSCIQQDCCLWEHYDTSCNWMVAECPNEQEHYHHCSSLMPDCDSSDDTCGACSGDAICSWRHEVTSSVTPSGFLWACFPTVITRHQEPPSMNLVYDCADPAPAPAPTPATAPSNMPTIFLRSDSRLYKHYTMWEQGEYLGAWWGHQCPDDDHIPGSCSTFPPPPMVDQSLVASAQNWHMQEMLACGICTEVGNGMEIGKIALFCSEDGTEVYPVQYSVFSQGCSQPIGVCDECEKLGRQQWNIPMPHWHWELLPQAHTVPSDVSCGGKSCVFFRSSPRSVPRVYASFTSHFFRVEDPATQVLDSLEDSATLDEFIAV